MSQTFWIVHHINKRYKKLPMRKYKDHTYIKSYFIELILCLWLKRIEKYWIKNTYKSSCSDADY